MQRRVTLLRHGHAEQHGDDLSRPLSQRGRAAVRLSAEALVKLGWIPELVLTSTARRAQATAELVAETLGYEGPIESDAALYLASESQYLSALRNVTADALSVLLVGHNPGLTGLARQLCQHPGELAPAELASACFDLEGWTELDLSAR